METLEMTAAVSTLDLATMLFIRHFETTLLDQFALGEIGGTTHTCLGQEYIPVALMPLLARDHVFSNHRGHGHYLARYDDPEGLLAEIMGRAGAICGGVGGSQHIWRDDYLSTGVQGQSVPVAAGVALHFQQTRQPRAAVAFIGDGTWGEGAVYEGLNIAALWRLPLVVIVENNGIAQSTETSHADGRHDRRSSGGFRRRLPPRRHRRHRRDPRRARAPVARVRAGGGPLVIEFATRRLGPHSKGDDSRTPAEIAALTAADWHPRLRAADPDTFDRVDDEQRQRMRLVLLDVQSRPLAGGARIAMRVRRRSQRRPAPAAGVGSVRVPAR